MTKHTLISLISVLFAASTFACAGAPPKEPETPKAEPDNAEMALLGIAPGASANQITPAKPEPAVASTKDDGSDIVPPFTAAKPAKAAPAKPTKPAKGRSKKTASR